MFNQYRDAYVVREIAPFKVDGLAIPYPEFIARLYNLCMGLGFRKGLIMPSRALCSDENQGLPIFLLVIVFFSVTYQSLKRIHFLNFPPKTNANAQQG
jgi:hypothetical protein